MSIYVITHKPYNIIKKEGYRTLLVGAYRGHVTGDVYDDAGDNISRKNGDYCELTGFYWIWRNTDDPYVGIDHYRRYFANHLAENQVLSEQEALQLLQSYDIILPQMASLQESVADDYIHHSGRKIDLEMLRYIVAEEYPDYLEDYDAYMAGRRTVYKNMMICSRTVFDDYCEWLFRIMFSLEGVLRIAGSGKYQPRIYGYLSERLLNVWVRHNRLRVCHQFIVEYEQKESRASFYAHRAARVGSYAWNRLTAHCGRPAYQSESGRPFRRNPRIFAAEQDELISCIVTTCRRPPEVLQRALDSVAAQTYRNIELIVVNDAPEDKELVQRLGELVASYPISTQYIVHERNLGACAARNTGLSHAKGTVVAFLDDDDSWLPDKLERQMWKMQTSGADIVSCAHYMLIDGCRPITIALETRPSFCRNSYDWILCENFIGSTSYPLIRRSVLDQAGGFDPAMRSSQDYDLWIRILKIGRLSMVHRPLVNYHITKKAISRDNGKRLQGYDRILTKYKDDYRKSRRIRNFAYNAMACAFAENMDFLHFFTFWWRAFASRPFSIYNFMMVREIKRRLQHRRIQMDSGSEQSER